MSLSTQTPHLITERLVLRPPVHEDARAIAYYASDYEVARWTAMMPHPYPVEAAEGWIVFAEHQRRRGLHIPLMMELRPSDDATASEHEIFGCAAVFRSTTDDDWEVGYWVAQPFWGRGYATEALNAVIAWARTELGATRLLAGHFEGNDASAHILTKAGFRLTGTSHEKFSLGRRERVRCIDLAMEFSESLDGPRDDSVGAAPAVA